MKKIIVTGSTGYLGSVLTGYLKNLGYICVGYDAGFFSDTLLYPSTDVNPVIKDARSLTEKDLEGAYALVHLAGISNDPLGKLDAAKMYDPTREYSKKISLMCKNMGIKFIFASSCSIYGVGGAELLDENSPVHPQTFYSLNKLQIEDDLRTISENNFDPIALRFATVFGVSPRIRFDVVINMLAGMAYTNGKIILNSDGQSWRPNLHILDLCQAVACTIELDNRGRGLQILNVGSDENNMKIIDIAKIVQSAIPGCELRYLSEDPDLDKEGLIQDRKVKAGTTDTRTYQVSFQKIKKEIPTFNCQWNIELGVKQLVDTFKEISLDYSKFKERGFYRLQQLEYLHGNKLINDDLYWTNESIYS
jgi:nucleoside-diphosphate-sugar epimerase